MLGCVEGKRVVELGAGIGRFTGSLAVAARSLLAIDFMENLIQENRRANGHRCCPSSVLLLVPLSLVPMRCSWACSPVACHVGDRCLSRS